MASIEFKNYFFDEFSYEFNKNFKNNEDQGLDVVYNFSSEVTINKDNALVILSVELGDSENENCPFIANVSLAGLFDYNYDSEIDSDKEMAKKLVSSNGVAILYPYIRNMVSDLTLKSNQFPAYILPVINVVQILKDEESINIIDLSEEDM